jgi:serine/threonine protein phosphatase PrpC
MVVKLMSYKVFAIGISDIGLVRENNEDVWAKLAQQRFFGLADGMGGHQAGEVASHETIDQLCRILSKRLNNRDEQIDLNIAREIIIDAILEVNKYVHNLSRQDYSLRGMGTTLCFLHFHPKGLIYGNVGDSRIYRLRHQKLTQITKDHSLLRELIDQGRMNERQAENYLHKKIITKAIGTEPHVEPSVRTCEVLDQDIYLMCSDGLSDLASAYTIETILNKKQPLKEIAQELIDEAKAQGGLDNITVVIAKVQEQHER